MLTGAKWQLWMNLTKLTAGDICQNDLIYWRSEGELKECPLAEGCSEGFSDLGHQRIAAQT